MFYLPDYWWSIFLKRVRTKRAMIICIRKYVVIETRCRYNVVYVCIVCFYFFCVRRKKTPFTQAWLIDERQRNDDGGDGDDGDDEIAYKSVSNEYGLSCFMPLAFGYSRVPTSLTNATHMETNMWTNITNSLEVKFTHTHTHVRTWTACWNDCKRTEWMFGRAQWN